MAYNAPLLVESTPHRKRYLISTNGVQTIGALGITNATLQANALQPLLSVFQVQATLPDTMNIDQARFLLESQFISDAGAAVALPAPYVAQQGPTALPVQSYYTPTVVCTITGRNGAAAWSVQAAVDPDTVHAALSVQAYGTDNTNSAAYLDIWLEHTLTR